MKVLEGDTAELKCQIKNSTNRIVSWLRSDTLHILSVGYYTFTTDPRYTADYQDKDDTWLLRIRGVKAKDGGTYECQKSGEPVVSYTVVLTVLAQDTEQLHLIRASRLIQGSDDEDPKDLPITAEDVSVAGGGGDTLMVPALCLCLVLGCLLSLGTVRTCLKTGPDDRGNRRSAQIGRQTNRQDTGQSRVQEIRQQEGQNSGHEMKHYQSNPINIYDYTKTQSGGSLVISFENNCDHSVINL